jgi:RND family efflux transporter MFP subunit
VSGRVSAVQVKVGDRVNQGQTLFQLDSAESAAIVQQSEASVGIARANVLRSRQTMADAELNFKRISALFQGQAVSQAQHDDAESVLNNARYGLQLSEEQLKQSEAALLSARESLSNYVVTAPISGMVASVNIHNGEISGPQSTAMTLVNLDTVKIKVNVSENNIGAVKQGADVLITISAINEDVKGKVVSMGPAIDSSTRAFPVEILLDNKQGNIKAGMVASLKLSSGVSKNAVTVPPDAVLEKDGAHSVFVVEEDTARELTVKTGIATEKLVEIKEGLKKDQNVIVSGNRLVSDGQKVKVVK